MRAVVQGNAQLFVFHQAAGQFLAAGHEDGQDRLVVSVALRDDAGRLDAVPLQAVRPPLFDRGGRLIRPILTCGGEADELSDSEWTASRMWRQAIARWFM
jgi:hypothetical protein